MKPPPKSGDMISIRPQLPATTAAGSIFRAFDRFSGDADCVLRRYQQIDDLPGAVRYDAHGRTGDLTELFAKAKRQAVLNESDERALARCRKALQRFNAAESYEGDDTEGDLRPGVIALRMAALLDAIPNAKPNNPEAYISKLMDHVLGIGGLTLPALDAACRDIAESRERLPTIPVVMKALREQQARWDERLWAIWNLADTSRRVVAEIEALEIETQQAANTRAAQQDAAARARAVAQAQRDLDDARARHAEALAELTERQGLMASSQAWVAICEGEVLKNEQALAEVLRLAKLSSEI